MKKVVFKKILLSILKRSINEIEQARKELAKEPFDERQYQNQENYEKFLEDVGVDELLIKMKLLIKKLEINNL